MKKTILVVMTFLAFSNISNGQVVADSLSKKGQMVVDKQIDKYLEDKLLLLKILTGVSVLSVSGYGLFLLFGGLKKKVEGILDKKAESLVEEKISKMAGLKIEDLQEFFAGVKKEKEIKSRRVCVVNKSRGKYLDLSREIEKAGFKTDDYRKMDSIKGIDNSLFDVVVLDNSDGSFDENEMVEFFKNHLESTKIVCLTSVDLNNEHFKAFSPKVKIIKRLDYLGENIRAALS